MYRYKNKTYHFDQNGVCIHVDPVDGKSWRYALTYDQYIHSSNLWDLLELNEIEVLNFCTRFYFDLPVTLKRGTIASWVTKMD